MENFEISFGWSICRQPCARLRIDWLSKSGNFNWLRVMITNHWLGAGQNLWLVIVTFRIIWAIQIPIMEFSVQYYLNRRKLKSCSKNLLTKMRLLKVVGLTELPNLMKTHSWTNKKKFQSDIFQKRFDVLRANQKQI